MAARSTCLRKRLVKRRPTVEDLRGAPCGDHAHALRALTHEGRPEAALASFTVGGGGYWIRVSILNIGRYIAITMTPTIIPTPIIMIGSMIEVSAWIDASTSSS